MALLDMDSYKHSHNLYYPLVNIGKSWIQNPSLDWSFDIETEGLHVDSPHYLAHGYRRVNGLNELVAVREFPMVGLGHFLHTSGSVGDISMENLRIARAQAEERYTLHSGSVGNIGIRQLRERRSGQNELDSFGRFYQMEATDFQLLLGNAPKVTVSSLLRHSGLQLGVSPYGAGNEYVGLLGVMNTGTFYQYYWDSAEEYQKKEKALKERIKSMSLYRVNKPEGKQYFELS